MRKVNILVKNKDKNKYVRFNFLKSEGNMYFFENEKGVAFNFDYTQTKALIADVLADYRVNVLSFYFKKYGLDRRTYNKEIQSKDIKFNLKLYLIYLDLVKNLETTNKEIENLENLLNSENVTISDYSKVSKISKTTLIELKHKKYKALIEFKTYLKIKNSNQCFQELIY